MIEVVFTLIVGIISGLFIIYWGYLIYDVHKLNIKWYHWISIFVYAFCFVYSLYNFSNLLHIGTILLGNLILHQIFFRKSFSIISSGIFCISVVRLLSIFINIVTCKTFGINFFNNYYWISSLYINIVIHIFILIFYQSFRKLIKYYDIRSYKSWRSVIVMNFIIIMIFIFGIPIDHMGINIILLYPLVSLLYLFITIYLFACQKVELDSYLKNYYEIAKFSYFMESLVDNYKTKLYNTKNELFIVKEKLSKKDKNVIDYLDSLIEGKSHIEYSWISELSYFKIPGIKGFLSYKIQEMKELGIDVEIFISDTLEQAIPILTEQELKDLYIIIGTFCDNAKDAAKNSLDKTVTFQAYFQHNSISILIANTYDKSCVLKNIEELGVSAKKKSYGTGLYIVRSIIENSTVLRKNTTIIDDFFIQELIIEVSN